VSDAAAFCSYMPKMGRWRCGSSELSDRCNQNCGRAWSGRGWDRGRRGRRKVSTALLELLTSDPCADTLSFTPTALRVGVVATGPRAKTELAPLFGLSSATFDRFLHALFLAGLIRRSGRGGGRAAVPLDDVEWARVLLALTALHPTGAAPQVGGLSPLMSWPPAVGGGGSLLTDLSGLIGILTRLIRDGRDVATIVPDEWSLTISADPLGAWVTCSGGIQHYRAVDEYMNEIISDQPPPLIQRLAVVSKAALVAVARLCATDGERPGRPPSSLSVTRIFAGLIYQRPRGRCLRSGGRKLMRRFILRRRLGTQAQPLAGMQAPIWRPHLQPIPQQKLAAVPL
jgi:hypothetical protein